VHIRAVGYVKIVVRAAVGEDEGVGFHKEAQGWGRSEQMCQAGVQVVQLVFLAEEMGAVGVVAAEAVAHVAVEDNALGRA
jgi:hypothetical protein